MTNTHKASLIRMSLQAILCVAMRVSKTEPSLPEFISIMVVIEWCVLTCPWIKEKEKDVA